MANKEVAYAPATAYQWFEYTGKSVWIENKKGNIFEILKGDVFGVRKNTGGTKVIAWVILAKLGTAKQLGADAELAAMLAKGAKPLKG